MGDTCGKCADTQWSAVAIATALTQVMADEGLTPLLPRGARPKRALPKLVREARCEPLEFAASGAMWLTGWPDDAPLVPQGSPATALLAGAGLVEDVSALVGTPVSVNLSVVLSGRAGLLGLRRRGRTSATGSCRLLRTVDGWVAVNLARPTDIELLPAVFEEPVQDDGWQQLAQAAARTSAADIADSLQLLAIPASALPSSPVMSSPISVVARGPARGRRAAPPLVVDLSSMWAGPICAHLLGRSGARVIKVESANRLDGAREGPRAFYAWLHGGHESVTFDFTTSGGRAALAALVERADVVIEASRPRALQQMGIDASTWLEAHPGRTWVSITGYGRTGPWSNRVAFGDDAAVAGALVAWDGSGGPVFCGDAVADPLTGIFAALGTFASIAAGGGHLLDVALSRVAKFVASLARGRGKTDYRVESRGGDRWMVHHAGSTQEVVPPARLVPGVAATAPGVDTDRVLAELNLTLR